MRRPLEQDTLGPAEHLSWDPTKITLKFKYGKELITLEVVRHPTRGLAALFGGMSPSQMDWARTQRRRTRNRQNKARSLAKRKLHPDN